MYLKDKTEHMTIRLNKRQMEYLNRFSEVSGIPKPEILRQCIDRMIWVTNEHNKAN